MADAAPQRPTLRWSRLEKKRLLVPLVLSLILHVVGLGVYQWGVRHHWWQPVKLLSALPKIPPAKKPPQTSPPEEQIVFVDVSQEEKEAPKKAKYYSSKNSQAANPDVSKDAGQPKIEGKQTEFAKTQSATRVSKLAFATPAPAALHGVTPTKTPAPNERGDLDMAQKSDGQKNPPSPAQRPRTLREAQQNLTPGEAMKQDGGVRRLSVVSSLDVTRTLFGDYDAKLIDAIRERWFVLIDQNHFAQDRTGKVVVHFKLKYDGTILEMKTDETSVGITLTYLCREAIQASAPFTKWPEDMRRMIGQNYRDVMFTFYY